MEYFIAAYPIISFVINFLGGFLLSKVFDDKINRHKVLHIGFIAYVVLLLLQIEAVEINLLIGFIIIFSFLSGILVSILLWTPLSEKNKRIVLFWTIIVSLIALFLSFW